MFSCHGCLASALRAVCHDVPAASRRQLSLPRDVTRALSTQQRLRRASANATATPPNASLQPPSLSYSTALTSKQTATDGRHERDVSVDRGKFTPKHLRKELEFLGDPLKLADHVKKLLHRDESDKAVDLVRLASKKNIDSVVSWNHLLNHAMSRRDVNRAWSLFNEMKKRAQRPDAISYTLMLRGLSDNVDNVPTAVEKAVTIYQSLSSPSSTVTPNLSHTNAVLQVCARAKQLDHMFEIASRLPSNGTGAADHITFTTILNAIRIEATDAVLTFGKDSEHGSAEGVYRSAIKKGKRIWEDVISRWSRGYLTIDEELVCAMGSLLLVGGTKDNSRSNPQDVDDVLSLLQQAMDIPRQFPRYKWKTRTSQGSIEAPRELRHKDSATMSSLDRGDFDSSLSPTAELEMFAQEDQSFSVFDPIPLKDSMPRKYARPGNRALSLAVTAAGKLREYEGTAKYWDLLTQVVKPDADNCHTYLRVLRYQRASRHSLAFVKQMRLPVANGGLGIRPEGKTFKIAMSACARDINNPACLDTALQLLELMRQTLDPPDLGTMQRFASVFQGRARHGDVREAMGAIEVLHKLLTNLWGAMRYGDFGSWRTTARPSTAAEKRAGRLATVSYGAKRGTVSPVSRSDVVELAKTVESATTRTMNLYGEELAQNTKGRWFEKLTQLRKMIENERKNEESAARARKKAQRVVREEEAPQMETA